MSVKMNRQWCVKSFPEGMITSEHYELKEQALPEIKDGQVLVRNIYLSIDPTNRVWMSGEETYLPPLPLGEPMRGVNIGIVEESKNSNFRPGDFVQGVLAWEDYSISDGQGIDVIPDEMPVPLLANFGLLGHIGTPAYQGMVLIGKVKADDTVVVSAAAGAVGSLACQIAKIHGARVIGIAGDDDKCNWLVNEIGIDGAINYKKESVDERLKELCPDGVDLYFENVGGDISDNVLKHINTFGRIPVCGLISQYNSEEPDPGPKNFVDIVLKRLHFEGFICLDIMAIPEEIQKVYQDLIGWYQAGKLKYRMDVLQGFENIPDALGKLFNGTNKGKLIVQISSDPKQ